jgi:3-oxoacyl-[acyl-carrier-protein] synthase III
MKLGRDVYLAGIGSFSPGEPVPFDQVEDVLGHLTLTPPKLTKRIGRMRSVMKQLLGVEYCHYAIDPRTRQATETNTTMATKSAKKAMAMAGVKPEDVDLIVYAGILYDYMCPPNSVFVQEALGIKRCAEMSIHSNCTAIYKALQVATDLVALGRYRNALVVSSQLSSPFLRSEYFNQAVMTEEQAVLRWFLSDGAGAMMLTSDKPVHPCVKVSDTYLESVGVGIKPTMHMMIGAAHANLKDIYDHGYHHLTQDIKAVAELAPKLGAECIKIMFKKWGLYENSHKVRCLFLNIPTKHMMDIGADLLRKELGVADIPVYTKLATRGYPGAPAIIMALEDYFKDMPLKPGEQILSGVTESSKWMHAGFLMERV